jgi:16S rRNA (guanine1516-N2)-methyltransferase
LVAEDIKARLLQLGLNPKDLDPILHQHPQYQLQLHENKLSVFFNESKKKLQYYVFVDFNSAKMQYRSQAHINAEKLVKAVIGKNKTSLKVLDATAGFGKDCYLLALAGCEVNACESNLLMFALLKDGFLRANIKAINLTHDDSQTVIDEGEYDVIYLDPMYPQSGKSAKNNKDMTFLQDIVGHQPEMAEILLEKSLKSKIRKIVVKRPVKSEFVLGKKPTSQIISKAVRFDIYARS